MLNSTHTQSTLRSSSKPSLNSRLRRRGRTAANFRFKGIPCERIYQVQIGFKLFTLGAWLSEMDYRDERSHICVVLALSCLIQAVTSCEMQTVLTALEECRHEREELNSIATRHDSNHTHICSVFEAFSQCMDPRVGECEGESTEAYRRQREYYTGQGFNCTELSAAPAVQVCPMVLSLPLLTATVYRFL